MKSKKSAIKITWFDASLGAPEMTIGPYGFVFNRRSIEVLGSPPRIKLGVLGDKKTLIVVPVEKNKKSTLTFASRERYGNVRYNSKRMVRFSSSLTGADFTRTSKFVGVWDDENGWLAFDLSKPVAELYKK